MQPKIPSSKRNYYALALLWLCFVARGVYYARALPVWEGFDEYSHFAFVEHLVQGRGIPVPGVSRQSFEVESSLRVFPLPWTLQDLRPGVISYDRWWELAHDERRQRLASLESSRAEDPSGGLLYESQQPPLYYFVMAPVLAVADRFGLPLADRVFVLRLASILLCSLALPLGWALARRVLGSEAAALCVVSVAISMPELLINVARVGNESMAIVAGTALCMGCVLVFEGVRCWRVTIATGVALGACLLTKVYFLSAIPAVCVIFLWARDRKAVARLAVALAIAAAACSWWYLFIHHATGDWTGMIQSVAVERVTTATKIHAALHLNWLRGIDVALFSHVWFGGWSFLQLRSWMYHVFYLIFLASLAGLVVRAVRGSWRALMAPALLEGFFCAGMGYHVVLGQIGYGVPMTSGWYWYCLVFAELVLVAAGLREIVTPRFGRWALPGLAGMFALLDIYGLSFVQVPYYTGVITHLANGRLPALQISQLAELPPKWGISWPVYLAATVCTVVIAFRREESRLTQTQGAASVN